MIYSRDTPFWSETLDMCPCLCQLRTGTVSATVLLPVLLLCALRGRESLHYSAIDITIYELCCDVQCIERKRMLWGVKCQLDCGASSWLWRQYKICSCTQKVLCGKKRCIFRIEAGRICFISHSKYTFLFSPYSHIHASMQAGMHTCTYKSMHTHTHTHTHVHVCTGTHTHARTCACTHTHTHTHTHSLLKNKDWWPIIHPGHVVIPECAADRGPVGCVGTQALPAADCDFYLCSHSSHAHQCLVSFTCLLPF